MPGMQSKSTQILSLEAFKRLTRAAAKSGVTEDYLGKRLVEVLKPESRTLPLDFLSKLHGRPVPVKRYDSAYVEAIIKIARNIVYQDDLAKYTAMALEELSREESPQ